MEVSIHAPVKGATRDDVGRHGIVVVSIHAPVKGATGPIRLCRLFSPVSIHAPVKGATSLWCTSSRTTPSFNPRAREGRD